MFLLTNLRSIICIQMSDVHIKKNVRDEGREKLIIRVGGQDGKA
jgi:hypothetical protein